MKNKPLILVIEDDDNDVLLIRRGFRRAGISNPCRFFARGEDAIAYLAGEAGFADRTQYPLPELILLDLKLPGIDGYEVLQWIRSKKEFTGIRVVVTTGDTELGGVTRAYHLGANSFLAKPLEFENPTSLALTLEGLALPPSGPGQDQPPSPAA
ncbi:MAG TPA: response regulator [Verrucomicrobiae bacterium]|nr:response regulator [Verrucomicrobiae bacterium]